MIIPIDPTKTPESGRQQTGRTITEFLPNFTELSGKIPTHSVKALTMPQASNAVHHGNFMQYLLACWNGHHGVVVRPDVIWFELLCELANLVNQHPDKFRHLFTKEAEGKGLIMIQTATPAIMPLDLLIERLRALVPLDAETFLPQFSTGGKASRFAHYAAFADMASPYYDYATYLCGIPAIMVVGTQEDWDTALLAWKKIGDEMRSLVPEEAGWFDRVGATLEAIAAHQEDKSPESDPTKRFWSNFFTAKKCGSGSDVEIDGWFSNLYRTQPDGLRKPCNFLPHRAIVNYTDLSSGTAYSMHVGVFFSILDEETNFLSPSFGNVVLEKLVT